MQHVFSNLWTRGFFYKKKRCDHFYRCHRCPNLIKVLTIGRRRKAKTLNLGLSNNITLI